MLDKDSVIASLRAHEKDLRAKGVLGLYLFGSVARGEARHDSDVDLFFDHPPGMGWEAIGLMEELHQLADGRGDVTTRGGLHPRLRARIEQEATRIF